MALTMPPLLSGRRIAVMGSAHGLGRAVAAAAEAAGAEVLGIDADKAFDHVSAFYRVDLGDGPSVDALAQALPDGLDGLALFPALPDGAAPDQVMALGVMAPVRLAMALAPRMAKGAAIVVRGAPPHADHAASLGAVRAALALNPDALNGFAARWGLDAEPVRAPRLAGWAMQAWAQARRWDWPGVRTAALVTARPDGGLTPAVQAARGIEQDTARAQAAQAAVFLLSDLAAGLTGATLAADHGLSAQIETGLQGL